MLFWRLKVPLKVAAPPDNKKFDGLKLGLSGDHQFINAGLAVSLCKCWLQRTGNWEKLFQNDIQEADLPESFVRGLSTAHIPGRAQFVYDTYPESNNSLEVFENSFGDLTFYLDGAHITESMEACAKWFSSAVKGNQISSASSFKLKNLEGVWGNGHIRHGSGSMEESNKLIKQELISQKPFLSQVCQLIARLLLEQPFLQISVAGICIGNLTFRCFGRRLSTGKK